MANANPEGIRRSLDELEHVAMNEGWSEQVRNPTRCLHFSNPPSPWHLHTPLRWKTCASVLNPYACVAFTAKIWICPFCYQRNHFPPHYSMISDTNLPDELYAQHTTDQYTLPDFHFHARYLHDRGGDRLCQIGFEACDVPLVCCPRMPLLATFHLGLIFRFIDWTSPTCSRFWFLR